MSVLKLKKVYFLFFLISCNILLLFVFLLLPFLFSTSSFFSPFTSSSPFPSDHLRAIKPIMKMNRTSIRGRQARYNGIRSVEVEWFKHLT